MVHGEWLWLELEVRDRVRTRIGPIDIRVRVNKPFVVNHLLLNVLSVNVLSWNLPLHRGHYFDFSSNCEYTLVLNG